LEYSPPEPVKTRPEPRFRYSRIPLHCRIFGILQRRFAYEIGLDSIHLQMEAEPTAKNLFSESAGKKIAEKIAIVTAAHRASQGLSEALLAKALMW